MLLSPSDGMANHVSCLLDVKVPSSEKAEKVSVVRHFAFVRLRQSIAQLDEVRLLSDAELTQESFDVFRVQFRGRFRSQPSRSYAFPTITICMG